MTHKRYYLILITVLSLSVLLLGMSYSKNNNIEIANIDPIYTDNLKILYSNDKEIKNDEELTIGIANKSDKVINYKIFIKEIKGTTKDIYYTLNNESPKLLENNTIVIDSINPYGTKNDYKLNTIKLSSTNNTDTYKIEVMEIEEVQYDSE